jgi:ABC-type polysaccharide/polyol phosphate export permease
MDVAPRSTAPRHLHGVLLSLATGIAIMNVYYRDLAHLVNVALQLLFYLTPILYTTDFIPESWRGIPCAKR